MKIIELILDEEQEETGVEAISIVESPAIESDFVALKDQEIKLAKVDEDKKILMGALLIPNKPIYRNGGEGEYYIYFSKDTVQKASQLYLKNGYQHNSTLEHNETLKGLTLVESWIVEDEVQDKSRKYGLNVPVGTWMGAVKVNNDEIWQEYVKTNKVKGFSIEGYFADKMEAPKDKIKEDMSEEKIAQELLFKIEKIVKGEKTELGKVELGLVDDAKKVVSKYADIEEDNAFSFVVKAEMEYTDLLKEYQKLLKEINSIQPKIEKAIQDLGVNRNNFGVLEDLDSRKSDINNRISVVKRNISDLKSINPN